MSLLLACGALDPTPRKPPKKDVRRKAIPPEEPITDEILAHMRWEYEEGGLTYRATAEKYGVTYDRVYRLLQYQTRAHIDPKRKKD